MKKLLLTSYLVFLCISLQSLQAQKKKKFNIFKELFGVSVTKHTDKFEGTTTYKMYGNKVHLDDAGIKAIAGIAFKSTGMNLDLKSYKLFMNLENFIPKEGENELSIVFRIEAHDEFGVNVMKGESLIFIIDDNRLALTTSGAFNSDNDYQNESSTTNARYSISINQFEKIINSKEATFRLVLDSYKSGTAEDRDKSNLKLDGTFYKKNFKAWKNFYQDYLINNPEKL